MCVCPLFIQFITIILENPYRYDIHKGGGSHLRVCKQVHQQDSMH